jgi:uncharacterized protein (DUF1499 family)
MRQLASLLFFGCIASACAWSHPGTGGSRSAGPAGVTSRRQALATIVGGLVGASGAQVALASSEEGAAARTRTIRSCPSAGVCYSTRDAFSVNKVSPWSFSPLDANSAFAKLKSAVQADALLKAVEIDEEGKYIRCVSKNTVAEFLIMPDDGVVTWSARSLQGVVVGGLTVTDGGAVKNTVENLRRRLGWQEAGVKQYLDSYTPSKRSYFGGNFNLEGAKSSYGEEEDF